jgi:uncharacterized protein Yka (UPF0111/DUF47 family)
MSIFTRKKPNRFIELLIKQSEHTEAGMQALLQFVRSNDGVFARRVSEIETEADEVRRILIDELNRTFVTPIDREDIFALSMTVDDILDYAYSTVEEMSLLSVRSNPYIERMVSLLTDARDPWAWSGSRIIPMWPTTTPCGPRRWKTAWRASTARRSPRSSRCRTTSSK